MFLNEREQTIVFSFLFGEMRREEIMEELLFVEEVLFNKEQ